jgi:hypothetical protein
MPAANNVRPLDALLGVTKGFDCPSRVHDGTCRRASPAKVELPEPFVEALNPRETSLGEAIVANGVKARDHHARGYMAQRKSKVSAVPAMGAFDLFEWLGGMADTLLLN